jgi:hypothetical protein
MPKVSTVRRCVALVTTAVAVLTACSSSDSSTVSTANSPVAGSTSGGAVQTRPADKLCGWTSSPPTRYQHVIWIWFENKSSGRVVGSSAAPYFNLLGKDCGYAANFHNISHPSLPNYLGATSGRTDGVARDCSPASCSSTSPSLFKQLQNAGLTWKGYAESMPRNCAIYDTPPYAARHNPPVYYLDVKNSCHTYDVPLGSPTSGNMVNDLTHNTLPNFSFITPNLCNDMHNCSVSTGDSWLKMWLTRIVASSAYSSGQTAIFVTFDEGGGGFHGEDCASSSNNDKSCLIATYVMGPAVPAGLQVSTRLTHYSMLRTTEALLGLKTFLGDAATATAMRQPFHL